MAEFSTPVRRENATEGSSRVPRAGAGGEFTHRSQGAIRARDWPGLGKALKMRFSRIYRKKRTVPLPVVHKQQKERTTMSDWVPPTQNVSGREEDWLRSVHCSHRAFCGCGDLIRHLASVAASNGYQPPPGSPGGPGSSSTPLVIRRHRALPAPPATPRPQPCGGRGGGEGRGDHGEGGGDGAVADLQDADVQELLDILDDAE